ncbi:MAG: hypothetical protein WED34_10365 [Planctomycetales bacterium]
MIFTADWELVRHCLCVATSLAILAFAVARSHTAEGDTSLPPLRVVCTNPGMGLLEEAAESFRDPSDGFPAVEVQRCHNDRMMDMLARGSMQMAAHGGPLDIFDQKTLRVAFPNGGGFEELPIAWFTVTVVVHPGVGIQSLTADQIGRICTGKLTNWEQLAGQSGKSCWSDRT